MTGEERLLDPVITNLSCYYQTPEYLDPLCPDSQMTGKPSDHRIILVRPINVINNKSVRTSKIIYVRPISQSGLDQMTEWLINEDWRSVYSCKTTHEKAKVFQDILIDKLSENLRRSLRFGSSKKYVISPTFSRFFVDI